MSEQILLQKDDVIVTPSRIVIAGKTYPLSGLKLESKHEYPSMHWMWSAFWAIAGILLYIPILITLYEFLYKQKNNLLRQIINRFRCNYCI